MMLAAVVRCASQADVRSVTDRLGLAMIVLLISLALLIRIGRD